MVAKLIKNKYSETKSRDGFSCWHVIVLSNSLRHLFLSYKISIDVNVTKIIFPYKEFKNYSKAIKKDFNNLQLIYNNNDIIKFLVKNIHGKVCIDLYQHCIWDLYNLSNDINRIKTTVHFTDMSDALQFKLQCS